MSFDGPNLNKGQGGLNRSGESTDAYGALVVFAPDSGETEFNTVNRLIQPSDAELLGFNAAFDANQEVLVYEHVKEVFRLAPEAILFLIVTNKATPKLFFESPEAIALFRQTKDIKRIGFVLNDEPVAMVLADQIAASQLFIKNLATDKIYIDGIYLEGRNLGATAATLRTFNSGNVSVVIAQDPFVASKDVAYAKYAAVGSVLGMRLARKPNENLGSVDIVKKPSARKGEENYTLTDSLNGLWMDASLSDGTLVSGLSGATKKQLTNFGYIYAGSFEGYPGVYFNGEPTCILSSSDYSSGENNGVWNKAARGIRTALIPKIRGWFKRDVNSGNLKESAITSLQTTAEKPLNKMMAAEECSGYEVVIPSNQNPTDETALKVKCTITLGSIIHDMDVDLSLN